MGTCCTLSTFALTFLRVLLIPFFRRFICPFAVAGLGFKYLVTSSSERLGHPFKKPLRKAFNREDTLGLHIAWCPNFTVFARVHTECVNMATDANSCNVDVLFHTSTLVNFCTLVIFCPSVIFCTLVIFCTSPSHLEVHSCL